MSLIETMERPPSNIDGKTIDVEGRAEALEMVAPSKLSQDQLFRILKGWFQADKTQSANWRERATFWFGFRAGDQWSEEDKAALDEKNRPHIVFNRVLTVLKAIAGMEINGRHEVVFLPRGTEDTAANEVLSAASKWMGDTCDAEDEESQAFDNAATVGLGFTENRMSYEDSSQGLYIEESVDPREMFWDRTACKKNLSDARRMHRVRSMPLGDAMQMFPGKTQQELDAAWASTGEVAKALKSIEERRRRDDPVSAAYDDQCEVTIGETQWWERETYWLVADVAQNTKHELSDAQYRALQTRWPVLQELKAASGMQPDPPLEQVSTKLTRKVYKRAFWGSTMLAPVSDSPVKGSFSWAAITGEFNAKAKEWFGLVKTMHDPQMWANKFFSQILHILNSTAKGGIIAELDAFEDQRQAEESYAMADEITWAATGAIGGPRPKIMEKPGAGRVGEYSTMLQFATTATRDVVGVNLELLGQQDMQQPGVVEMMRKQAGMTVLATLFDSLRRFRKQVGRKRLFFIQQYFSDGRLFRVVGPDKAQAVALTRDKTCGEYDVVVDDTPTSPNQKEANWAIIQPLLVAFRDKLMEMPEVFAALLEYSPLPSRVVEMIKKFVADAQNDPETQQTQKAMRELGLRKLASEISKNEATAKQSDATAMLNITKAGSAEGDSMYAKAMALNMLEDNNWAALREQIDAMEKSAKADKAHAEADAIRAKARHARLGLDTELIDAETRRRQADTAADHAGIEAAEMPSKIERNVAAAHKDHRIAHRERIGAMIDALTPIAQPGAN